MDNYTSAASEQTPVRRRWLEMIETGGAGY